MAITCAEWQTRFDEADAALHKLMTGGNVVSIRYGEKEVQYAKGNIAELRKYVQYLADRLAACNGTARRSAIGIIPG